MPAAQALLRRTICPHCWTKFAPADVLWISSHSDLLGDPRLGREEQQRFLPTRFDLDGNALDAKGFACQRLACPKCHLPIPRALLEIDGAALRVTGTVTVGAQPRGVAFSPDGERLYVALAGSHEIAEVAWAEEIPCVAAR